MDKERVRKFGEVFTPEHIVNNMLDMLEKENPGAFSPGTTFLEPTCGEGAFVVEILRRKFQNCKTRADYTTAIESVYGMELLKDNVEITIHNVTELCEKYFKVSKKELETIKDHVIQCDSLKIMRLLAVYGDNPEKLFYVVSKSANTGTVNNHNREE